MRILALSSYPREAAATRFRVEQFIGPLAERGIELDLKPFLSNKQFLDLYVNSGIVNKLVGTTSSVAKRVIELGATKKHELLFIQREAMPFGPAIFEGLHRVLGRLPMVLDLDDATYVPYQSPTYGRVGSMLKFFGKTNQLIDRSRLVICGNRIIAEYVEARGTQALVLPTIVDTDTFFPRDTGNEIPVIGWIGTHSTFKVLKQFFPILQRLARVNRFRLKVVGSGVTELAVEGLDIENIPWSLESEVQDFQSFDIGLYPIAVTDSMLPEWIKAKSGFKAIQYFATGIPFVMSPVGICAELGEPGITHFNAVSDDEWFEKLSVLLRAPSLRARMGAAGRDHSLRNYSFQTHTDALADVLKLAAGIT